MKRDDFETFLDGVLGDVRKLFLEKRSQYAKDDEVLHNFKDVATSDDTTPEDVLWGFVRKHWSAIKLMINFDKYPGHSPSISSTGITDDRFTLAQYKDKCMDVINYMILLMAIVADRKNADTYLGKLFYASSTTYTKPVWDATWDPRNILDTTSIKDWEKPDDTPTHE
jgi:hypothetical protein